MSEMTVGQFNYQFGKLAAMTQFHVVRRLAPVLAAMGLSITEMVAKGKSLKEDDVVLFVMDKASDVLAKMSNEDAEYIIHSCLAVVRRQQGDRWMPMMTGKSFQFQDIDMQLMIQLTVEVLKENLASFFPQAAAEKPTSDG